MRNILGMVAGYGLLTVTGNEHRQMRKTMNPAFSLSNLIARRFPPFTVSFSSFSGIRDTNTKLGLFLAETDMYYDHIETCVLYA